MAFGKTYRTRRRAKTAGPAKPAENVRVRFTGKANLEQLSAAFQTFIAALQERNVHSVENCALYLAPLDRAGQRMLIRDKNGSVLEVFEIDIPGAAPASAPAGIKRLVSPAVFGPGIDEGAGTKNVSAFNSRA